MSGSDYERELKSIFEDEYDYVVIRSAGSLGEGDLVALYKDRLHFPKVIEVKSTNKDTYYSTNTKRSKEQYQDMRNKQNQIYGIEFLYCVRWKDYTHKDKKDKWEVYDPLDSHIMKKGEGVPLDEVF